MGYKSDEFQHSNDMQKVIRALTDGTPSQGIELAPQTEVEGELRAYLADMRESLRTGETSKVVETLKTSMGVVLAGERIATIKSLTTGTASQGIEYADAREVTGELATYFEELATAISQNDPDTAVDRVAVIMGVCLAGDRSEVVRFLTQDTSSQGIEAAPVEEILGELPFYVEEMARNLQESDGKAFAAATKTFFGVAIAAEKAL